MNETTDQTKIDFHKTVSEACSRYLQMFPEEQERLATLTGMLARPELDLRQRSTIPEGHMCASGIILLPESKIQMVEHKGLGIWVVPGGHYDETDPSLTDTAIRETIEETGIEGVELHPWHLENGIPLDIDTHPIPANDKKNEGAHQHFDFRYVLRLKDGINAESDHNLDTNEVLSLRATPFSEVDPSMSIYAAVQKLGLLDS